MRIYIYYCLIQICLPHNFQNILKIQIDYVILLLKTFQWLPMALRIKFKPLNVASEVLCDWVPAYFLQILWCLFPYFLSW